MIVRRMLGTARKGRDSGFTLIEVLVSLILLALVLTLLSGGMRFVRGTWDATAKLDERAGYDMAESFLRARLGEAIPVYERTPAGTVRVAFQGTSDALTFVAPAPNGPAGAGLYQYALELVPGVGRERRHHALAVKLAPYQMQQSQRPAEVELEQHILVGNARSLALRYYGRGELRAQAAWHTAWTRTDAFPELVELTIARDDGLWSVIIELRLRPRTQ